MGDRRPKVLLVPNALFFPPYLDEVEPEETVDSCPRAWIRDIDADITYLDHRLLTSPPAWRKRIYRRLPIWVVQVLESFRVGRAYDVVFLWSVADVTLILSLLLKISRRKMTIAALLTRVSEPKKAQLLKRVHGQIDKIILPPVTQREFAIRELGVPAEKFIDLPWTVDTDFWRASATSQAGNTICAAGGEMRDYHTLIRAMEGLDIPCHIAGVPYTVRPDWWNATEGDRTNEVYVPANVTFGTMSAVDLRALYARSRFVVVPLKPTNSDNGITSMNEAWSLGRAVIVSAVEGQKNAFVDGQEGVWVPPGDVLALRNAIIALWETPNQTSAMGSVGRQLVERSKDHRIFSCGVSRVLRELA